MEINNIQDIINSSKKLKYNAAKELYIKYFNETNLDLKRQYMDELIFNTLYIVDNYIKRNNLIILCNSKSDYEDLYSAFIEVWIRKLKGGILLNVSAYSYIFNPSFMNDVFRSVIGESINFFNIYNLKTDHVAKLFSEYTMLKNNNKEIITDNPYYKRLILIFDGIYKNLNIDVNEDFILTKHKSEEIIELLYNVGIFDILDENIESEDQIESLINDITMKEFMEDVDSIIKNEENKYILYTRYNIYDYDKMRHIASKYNVTRQEINRRKNYTLNQLKQSKKLQKYKKID